MLGKFPAGVAARAWAGGSRRVLAPAAPFGNLGRESGSSLLRAIVPGLRRKAREASLSA